MNQRHLTSGSYLKNGLAFFLLMAFGFPNFVNAVANTPTKTSTPTKTKTPTITSTPTKTKTPTITLTPTKTNTSTITPTSTKTPTNTSTNTLTNTSTYTPTSTYTFTPTTTNTYTNTSTDTSTTTFTDTVTPTTTDTVTETFTDTLTTTFTDTPTPTPTETETPTSTPEEDVEPLEHSQAVTEFNQLPEPVKEKLGIHGFLIYVGSHDSQFQSFLSPYPGKEIDGVSYVGVVLESLGGDPGLENVGAIEIRSYDHNFFGAQIPANRIADLASLPGVLRMESLSYGRPLLDQSLVETNVRQVQQTCNPTLKGQGVVVGIVDTGLDINHPDFKNGTVSRVENLWDAGIRPSGVGLGVPPPFSPVLGQNWFQNPTGPIPSLDVIGHGTHVTGIAAGNGSASFGQYAGVAPEASIMFVKAFYPQLYLSSWCPLGNSQALTTDEMTVLDGIRFIFNQAGNRPAVINLSLGFWFGPHDGTSVFESIIDTMVGPSRLVVAAVGNDRSSGYHASGTIPLAVNQYQEWRWMGPDTCDSFSTLPGVKKGLYEDIDGWYDPQDDFYIVIQGRTIGATASKPTTFFKPATLGSFVGGVSQWSRAQRLQHCQLQNVYWDFVKGHFRIRFLGNLSACPPPGGQGNSHGIDPGPYTIKIVRRTVGIHGSGLVDMWNGPTALGSNTMGTFRNYGVWDDSDHNKSLSAPFATAKKVISVGAYVTRVDTCLGFTDLLGDLASFSAWGPTRDGRKKPEVAAPGEIIVSTRSSQIAAVMGLPTPVSCQLVGPGNYYLTDQGTSMAAPHVTGLLALHLQQNPSIDYDEAVNILKEDSAPAPNQTPHEQNNQWGYGKMRMVCLPLTPTPCTVCQTPVVTYGTGVAGSQSDQLNFPRGIAIGRTTAYPGQALYVAGGASHRVHKFIFGSAYAQIFDGVDPVLNPGGFVQPLGVGVDAMGTHLYVADMDANKVLRLDSASGAVLATVTTGFNGPADVTVDSNGNVFVVDRGQVTRWNADLTGPSILLGTVLNATGITAVGTTIYVADTGNSQIIRFVPTGSNTYAPAEVVATSNQPRKVAFDPSGRAYAVNNANQLEIFDTTTLPWTRIIFCNSGGSQPGGLDEPAGIAFNAAGNYYISESQNNRVEVFAPVACLPVLPTFTPTPCFNCSLVRWSDGAGSGDAQVSLPGNVLQGGTSAGASIYVADTANHRLEVLDAVTGGFLGQLQDFNTFNSPVGLAFDGPKTHIFMTSLFMNQVFYINRADLNPLTSFGGGELNQPTAVWTDDHGDVWVSDSTALRKYMFNSTTETFALVTTLGGFDHPSGVLTFADYLYVADTGNNRIQRWLRSPTNPDNYSLDATVWTGTGPGAMAFDSTKNYVYVVTTANEYKVFDRNTTPWTELTSCSNVSLAQPSGISVDADNNFYISSYSTNTVYKMAPLPCPLQIPGGVGGTQFNAMLHTRATPTPTPSSAFSRHIVMAAPNVSRDGRPIGFHVELEKTASIHLTLFSTMGEKVYDVTVQGTAGDNSLSWNLENEGGAKVASGLYLYVVQVEDEQGSTVHKGKVAILH